MLLSRTLDEKMAAWLRQNAAQRGISVSRFLGDLVHERMGEARDYNEAKRRFFTHKPIDFEWADGHRPTREEINDRARAREDLLRETSPRNIAGKDTAGET